jgi:isochorismate synthase
VSAAPDRDPAQPALRDTAAAAARAAAQRGRAQLLAWTAPCAVRDFVAAFGTACAEERFLLERPAEGRALLALGCAARLEARGPQRFESAAQSARELFANLHALGSQGGEAGPLLVGGFAFFDAEPPAPEWAGFPAARLELPEALLARAGGEAHLTLARRIEPGADPARETAALIARRAALERELAPDSAPAAPADVARPEFRLEALRSPADYRARVAAALREIGAGELEKVVLARSVRLAGGFDAPALLTALSAAHPSCATFAVARPEGMLVGASPERLLRRTGRRVEAAALAGSAPRGRSPEEDARLGRELLESKKEQTEHAIVVRGLRDALAGCCARLEVPEAPQLLRLDGIQHLETALVGTLASDLSAVALAGRLHPTPSVAGAPCEAALRWLARHEGLARGWYAGPLGCVGPSGDGELWLALRCALLRGSEALLYAGAGIVAGSQPEAELHETRLKLRALLAPMLEV